MFCFRRDRGSKSKETGYMCTNGIEADKDSHRFRMGMRKMFAGMEQE